MANIFGELLIPFEENQELETERILNIRKEVSAKLRNAGLSPVDLN